MADDVKVTLNINAAVAMLSDAVAEPLHEEKNIILGNSHKYVPILRGPLIQSSYTSPWEETPNDVTVKNGYDTHYALLQHETREFKHRPPASWKFLQRAEVEYASRLPERIAAKANARLGSGL